VQSNVTLIYYARPKQRDCRYVQDLSATAGSRARGITGDDDGNEGFFIQPKLAKGAARRLTEYFLILSLGKSEFHHFNSCSLPPSTQEGVLIAT
jgi:hypothetical protein